MDNLNRKQVINTGVKTAPFIKSHSQFMVQLWLAHENSLYNHLMPPTGGSFKYSFILSNIKKKTALEISLRGQMSQITLRILLQNKLPELNKPGSVSFHSDK